MTTYVVSYTSVAKVLEALPSIGSGSTVISGTILAYAERAEAEINARLAKAYSLPIKRSVPLLTSVATDLTIHGLLAKRMRLSGKVDEDVLRSFSYAREVLEDVVAGKIPLVDSSGSAIATSDSDAPLWTNTEGYTPTFHEGPWSEMDQDEDKLQDIRDDRS